MKPIVVGLVFLLSVIAVQGATLHGSVYDLSLNPVNGILITINTTPEQQLVSQDGSYAWELAAGTYLITAQDLDNGQLIASVEEHITIGAEGVYVRDLILFPDFDDTILEEIDVAVPDVDNKSGGYILVLLFVLIMGFFIVRALMDKSSMEFEEHQEAPLLDGNYHKTILDVLAKEGGRATQKEIRKHLPLSEAKVSLLLAELEHKGLVEKIKKGRGNIVVLKR